MTRLNYIVVSATLLIVVLWFFLGNFGGVLFGTPSGLTIKDIKGEGITISSKQKKEYLEKIHEILRNQR